MAFDGITAAALTAELNSEIKDGRIAKIAQTQKDELLITIRRDRDAGAGQTKLYLSANPSLPLCYLTDENIASPQNAPAFCMLLRKYLTGGRITGITQPSLERVIRFDIEHRNEMGDLCIHTLIIELMGKHSNIILTETDRESGEETVVDAIRHVSSMMSSVREVLPGRIYFIPETRSKSDPLSETAEGFAGRMLEEGLKNRDARGFLMNAYQGISGISASEIAKDTDERKCVCELDISARDALWDHFCSVMDRIRRADYDPVVYYSTNAAGVTEPAEYSPFPFDTLRDMTMKRISPLSALLREYYREKNLVSRIRQRSADLRHLTATLLERCVHKYDLQKKQMEDTKKREKDKLYGELILANTWQIPAGASEFEADNYYTGEKVLIKLDPELTPSENAVRYYDRYAKRKRTEEALEKFLEEGLQQIEELKGIQTALEFAQSDSDLSQIRLELEEQGYLKKNTQQAKGEKRQGRKAAKPGNTVSRPLHYISSDGFDLYVGKNNIQNDEVSFRLAGGGDLWFHANDIPGSHVIAKTAGRKMEELPDRLFEEAASLAAYYSAGRNQSKVEIDYLERRNLKKPQGAKPGFVIYHTNYSILARPDISALEMADTE